jgi:hypothetical protein
MMSGASNWTQAVHSHSIYSQDQTTELHEGLHPETRMKSIVAGVRGYKAGPQAVTGGTNSAQV